MEFSFYLQRFHKGDCKGNLTAEGYPIEAGLINDHRDYYILYPDVEKIIDCYPLDGPFYISIPSLMLYRTQQKWGKGNIIVSKRISRSGVWYRDDNGELKEGEY